MINLAKDKDAKQIAFLHVHTINKGFLPKLGLHFLEQLYKFLIAKEFILVYKQDNKVYDFISCALSSEGIMK